MIGEGMTLRFTYIPLFFIVFIFINLDVRAAELRKMDDKEKVVAQNMSQMYAEHLFRSSCMQYYQGYMTEYGDDFTPETDPELRQRLVKACDCYTKGVVQVANPEDIITYVRTLYGYRKDTSSPPSPELRAYIETNSFGRMSDYTEDPKIRKKCGFGR
jgi:hypothetical protein